MASPAPSPSPRNYTSFTPAECAALQTTLLRYKTTDVSLLRGILIFLVVAAAVNLGAALVACVLPWQRMSVFAAATLLLVPISVIVPFVRFHATLQALDLKGVVAARGKPALPLPRGTLARTVGHCKGVFQRPGVAGKYPRKWPKLRKSESDYYFGDFPGEFEIAVIACGVASTVIGTRSCVSALRGPRLAAADAAAAQLREEAALAALAQRRHDLLDRAGGSSDDLSAVLARARIDPAAAPALAPKQCVICLDDLRDGPLSMLPCTHAFHEKCIADWLRASRRRECPICKTAAAADSAPDADAPPVTAPAAPDDAADGARAPAAEEALSVRAEAGTVVADGEVPALSIDDVVAGAGRDGAGAVVISIEAHGPT